MLHDVLFRQDQQDGPCLTTESRFPIPPFIAAGIRAAGHGVRGMAIEVDLAGRRGSARSAVWWVSDRGRGTPRARISIIKTPLVRGVVLEQKVNIHAPFMKYSRV